MPRQHWGKVNEDESKESPFFLGDMSVPEMVRLYYGPTAVIDKANFGADMFCAYAVIYISFPEPYFTQSGRIRKAIMFVTHDIEEQYFYEIVEGDNGKYHVLDAGQDRELILGGGQLSVRDYLDGEFDGRNYYHYGIRLIMEAFIINYDTCNLLSDHIEKQRVILSSYVPRN